MRIIAITSLFLFCAVQTFAQDVSNLANMTNFSGNTQQQNKLGDVPVNIFTGMPNVSVPIYNYSNAANGLTWSLSLSYFAGGTQIGESSSNVGLGWFLDATGSITRTVRGMPDDVAPKGYMYGATIPIDSRTNMNKFYFDSLDGEQDIFQFNVNGRSGKFVIGKDKQIIQIPNTKLKISYTKSSGSDSSIISFRIVAEDGTKYEFETEETTSIGATTGSLNYGYLGSWYGSAWFLTRVIAPFNTDTIKFNYTSKYAHPGVSYPQVEYVRTSDNVKTATYHLQASSTVDSYDLDSITFPDKRSVKLLYNYLYNYTATDYTVAKIKICDSIFRYGFALDYDTSVRVNGNKSIYLKSVVPYTSKQMERGYSFTYSTKYVPGADSDYNKADYWGFYNGKPNGTNIIPKEGVISGANRSPDINYAIANSLSYYYLPGGGYIYYEYELNDHYPYTKSIGSVSVSGNVTTVQSNTVTFNQVFGTKQRLIFTLDPTVSRVGTSPISGAGTFTCSIKSTDGSITYRTTTQSLTSLFDLGMLTYEFNIPNGTYTLEVQITSGTTISVSFPFKITWENKTVDNAHTGIVSGGLRVKRISRRDDTDDPNVTTQDFQYFTADGKSSGFLGDTVSYSYPYSESVTNGSTVYTDYTVVNSQPVSTQNYTQGSPVGYSRVTVFNGSSTHNLGYTVYDFTTLQDVNSAFPTYVFPYTPQDIREWGIGLPKQISIYDSSDNLVKRTVNTIKVDTALNNSSVNYRSLKLGNTFTQYYGDPANSSTPRTRTFIGQLYYPSSGRAYITATKDTLYNTDGSKTTSYKNYTIDTNFNVSKITTSYNRTLGLQVETQMYYPYNYTVGGAIGILRDSGIISPVIATESWIIGDANPRIISGSITDYQQLAAGYIKPLTGYALQTNAPVAQAAIGSFDPAQLNRSSTYFIAQTNFPAYDNDGHVLEVKNMVSGQSNSLIMDYNKEYPIAQVSNATSTKIAYTSFESDGTGNWTIGSSVRDNSGGVTGKKAYNLSNGNISKSGLTSTAQYIVSVWAKTGASVNINSVAQTTPIAQQSGWNFYFTTLASGITSVTVSGTGVIDELRLYPKDANMGTTTYEPLVGATSSSDANSTVSYTTYDYLNRPKLIKDKDLNVIKRFDYSDKDSIISLTPAITTQTSFQWVGTDSACAFDSATVSIDRNFWSDTWTKVNESHITGFDYCRCSWSSHYPQYKLVGGVCSLGYKQYSAAVLYGDGWHCTYHYVYNDCSISGNYSEILANKPTITSGCQ